MNKKIFLVFVMLFFLVVPTVMATGLSYEKNDKGINDMKVSVKNTILFGLIKTGEQGTMELKSHKTPNEVLKVGAGWQVTMFYDMNFKDAYANSLGDVTFIDMRTGKEVQRDYKFVYWGTETRQRDTCLISETITNKINSTSHQECVKYGKENYTYEGWLDYNSKDIPKGKIRLGLMTNVRVDDYVDGIWKVQGKKIKKHAEWTADLNTDIVSYYKLEETSGAVVDETGTNNGTNNGATRGATGIIDNGFDFVASESDDVQISDDASLNPSDEITISIWFKPDSLGESSYLASKYHDGSTRDWEILLQNNDEALFRISIGNSHQTLFSSNTASGTGWHHLVGTYDGSSQCVYLDNTQTCTSQSGSMDNSNADLYLGANDYEGFYTNGLIDEVGIWSRALSSSEITQLYNSGSGISYTGTFGEVTSLSPDDSLTTNNPTVDFVGNTTYEDVVNFSLIIDDTYEQTNTSGLSGNYTFTETLSDGVYSWLFESCDSIEGCVNSTARTLTVDTTPFIEFISPTQIDNYNDSIGYLPIKVNLTETYFQNVTFNLGNGTELTYTDGTREINLSMTDGSYNYNATVWTTTGQTNSTETRTINIDTTNPTVFQSNLTDLSANPLPINSTWSIDAYDLHLDNCYYNTSDDATQQIVTCNSTISDLEWVTEGNKTIQYCANDTFGFETCLTDYIYIYEISATTGYSHTNIPETYDFTSNLTVNRTNSIPTTTAILELNNTNYSVIGVSTGNKYLFEKTVNIPEGWGNITGNAINWKWYYTIDGIGSYNTSNTNLNVYELDIDDCSSYGVQILSLSLKNEKTNILVNESNGANVEVDLTMTSKDNSSFSYEYSKTWEDENNPILCVPDELINNTEWEFGFTVGFQATDHVWEFFYLDGGVLDSTRVFDDYTDYTINLQDLLTIDSTSFLFNYFDQDGLPSPNSIVHVYRKYIGDGVFREIERSRQDSNGDTIVHLVEEDVIYYFIITDNGQTLYTSNEYTALCQDTPCTLNLEASGDVAEFPTDYDLINGGAISLSKNPSTRKVTLTYLTNTSKIFNLTIYKYENDGSFSAVASGEQTSIAGVTDTISLTVPQVAGNKTFFSNVFVDGSYIRGDRVDFEENASDRFGSTLSIFLSILIILTLGLIAITEGSGTIVFVILGVLLSGALGLVTTELSTGVNILTYLIVIGGLILWKTTKK